MVVALFGAMMIGCEVTVLNSVLTESELKPQLKEINPHLLVTNTRYLSKSMHACFFASDSPCVDKILLLPCSIDDQKSESVDLIISRFSQQNLVSYEQLLRSIQDQDLPLQETFSRDYSLGTFSFRNGRQKNPRLLSFSAVNLSTLFNQFEADGAFDALQASETVLGLTPLFCLRTIFALVVTLNRGATFVCGSESGERNIGAAIQAHSAAMVVVSPQQIRSLVLTEQAKWNGVKCWNLHGLVCLASCPVDAQMAKFALALLRGAQAKAELFLHQMYGASYLTPFTHSTRVNSSETGGVERVYEQVKQLLRRNRNVNRGGFVLVGKALRDVDCVIASLPNNYAKPGYVEESNLRLTRDENEDVGSNKLGEVYIRSKCVPSASTRSRSSGKTLAGSYVFTGDIGYRDEHGVLYVLPAFNRRQVLSIDNCEVSPAELEAALTKCSGVNRAHVFACPHPKGYPSEFIAKAVVVPTEIANFRKGSLGVKIRDTILAQLKTHLAEFKIPSIRYRNQNGIVLTEELPMVNGSEVDHWRIHTENCGPRTLAYFENAVKCQSLTPLEDPIEVESKESLSSLDSNEEKGFVTPPAPPMDELNSLRAQQCELNSANAKLKKEKAKIRNETLLLLEKLEETQKAHGELKLQLRAAVKSAKQADSLLGDKREENKALSTEVKQLKQKLAKLQKLKSRDTSSNSVSGDNSAIQERVDQMKQELDSWKQRCGMYQNSLKRQQIALTESEEKLRLANEMRQREHEENAFRLKKLHDGINQLKAKNSTRKKKIPDRNALYEPEVITRLLNASREEIRHLMRCRVRHKNEAESLKSVEQTLKARNEHLETLCHRLNVENSVAVDFMLKLNEQKKESPALLGSPESKLVVDHSKVSAPVYQESHHVCQGEAPRVTIHRSGSMEITMDSPHSAMAREEWPVLDNMQKPVVETNVSFDVAQVRQNMANLAQFFSENDMSFPLFEEESSNTPQYKLLIPGGAVEELDTFDSLKVGLEQGRLVAKPLQGGEFKDLIQMLLA